MEKDIYTNRKEFHKAFKKFLWTDENVNLLPGCGWNDGGCRSLMKAMQLWLGQDQVKTFQLVKKKERKHSEHAFVKIGDYYMDGDGISTHKALYQRWKYAEGLPSVFIRQFNPEIEPDCLSGDEPFYIEEDKIKYLVNLLNVTFEKDKLLRLLLKN